jgi:hypothetical protein
MVYPCPPLPAKLGTGGRGTKDKVDQVEGGVPANPPKVESWEDKVFCTPVGGKAKLGQSWHNRGTTRWVRGIQQLVRQNLVMARNRYS